MINSMGVAAWFYLVVPTFDIAHVVILNSISLCASILLLLCNWNWFRDISFWLKNRVVGNSSDLTHQSSSVYWVHADNSVSRQCASSALDREWSPVQFIRIVRTSRVPKSQASSRSNLYVKGAFIWSQ